MHFYTGQQVGIYAWALALLALVVVSAPASLAKPVQPAKPPTAATTIAAATNATTKPTYAELLKSAAPNDWRPIDNDNTLYMELATGRVVFELAPAFSPLHVANIKTLVREGFFDGTSVMRVQENYVVQFGDADGNKPMINGKAKLPPEFTVPLQAGMAFTPLPDADGYAKQVGFANGFHAGRDPKLKQTWLTHCTGALGVGRDNELDSGSGSELYVVTGHAPRQLDRNIALVGRIVQGMSLLTVLPRGTKEMGFYEKPEQRVPIKSMRVAADTPQAERSQLEIIRTDTPRFKAMVEALRNRGGGKNDWYKVPAGYIELCNVPIAVRVKPQ